MNQNDNAIAAIDASPSREKLFVPGCCQTLQI
jgi:hypothetical protein